MKHLIEMQKELSNEIRKISKASAKDIAFIKNYVGRNSELIYLGISLPKTRGIFRSKLKVHQAQFEDQFQVFEKNWFEAPTHDQKSLSIFWLETLATDQLRLHTKTILAWAPVIDNWALSDGLCNIFARLLEINPSKTLPVYKKWNRHKNPWLRRCSMVVVFYYSRSRKVQPTFSLACSMVEPHFLDSEYYVQKAVGWTIREMYNVYPDKTVRFIKQNIAKISSVAWVAASEKLNPTVKRELLQLRRLSRRKTR